MDQPNSSVSLFVDGNVLKQHIQASGQVQTVQLLTQHLTHMAQEIKRYYPKAELSIYYYGVRGTMGMRMPISGNMYVEPDMKKGLNHHSIPGAWLQNSWGKIQYPFEQPWILKPEKHKKETPNDRDFVLNERPKGILAPLVDAMAEMAVRHPTDPMFVYGDPDDMAYALQTTKWLGVPVKRLSLQGKTPYVEEISIDRDLRFCDKQTLDLIRAQVGQQKIPFCEALKRLRQSCLPENKKNILMIDMGVVRQYLKKRGYGMTVSNVQALLDKIGTLLPGKPSRTILYFAFGHPTMVIDPVSGKKRLLEDMTDDKKLLSLPNVEFSLGKTRPDKTYPMILRYGRWKVPVSERKSEDYACNLHQYDVDDRIAYDLSLARANPAVQNVFLLTTDGDFARSVESARDVGLSVSVLHLNELEKDMSFRLERGAHALINIQADQSKLVSKIDNRTAAIQQKINSRKKRRKELQRHQRIQARLERDDEYEYSDHNETRQTRWGKVCASNKREHQNHIIRASRN